jgi:nitroreductase
MKENPFDRKRRQGMIRDLVLKNRSYRRFYQEEAITPDVLRELVDLARQTASARNAQPLKYILSWEPEKNAMIFKTLAWAGYLKGWGGPVEGERPSAYIVILGDTGISPTFGCDHGIAAQTILLGATERGLGGCILGSVQRPAMKDMFHIPAEYEILVVLALGKPKETVVLETVGPDGDIKYWRDEAQVHHVPKRKLDEIIIG